MKSGAKKFLLAVALWLLSIVGEAAPVRTSYWVEFCAEGIGWAQFWCSSDLINWRMDSMTAFGGSADAWKRCNVYPRAGAEQQTLFVKVFVLDNAGQWQRCPARICQQP